MIIARIINGLGLGFTTPLVLAMVADLFPAPLRGNAYGAIGMASNAGAALGSLLATSLAGHERVGQAPGWRIAFWIVAAASVLLGAAVFRWAKDPRSHDFGRNNSRPPASFTRADIVKEAKAVLQLRTFWVLVIQGVLFLVPWYALNYFTLWLELSGWTHSRAAAIRVCFDAGMAVGVVLGGKVSDWASITWGGAAGRIATAQFSVGIGIPMWLAILLLPWRRTTDGAIGLSCICFATGLLTQWEFPSKASILAELVPPSASTSIFALSQATEGVLAAASAPLAGLLAERAFGFTNVRVIGVNDEEDVTRQSEANANALASAMATCLAVSWFLCVGTMGIAHNTFPADKSRQRCASTFGLHIQDTNGMSSLSPHHSSTYNPVHGDNTNPGHDIGTSIELRKKCTFSPPVLQLNAGRLDDEPNLESDRLASS
jgi:predicted MFS family arabinose efflux permease